MGILAGIGAGTLVGVVNGIGVALFNVSPFMMTLGTATISFGIALTLTSGVPVYGMPDEFGTIFSFARIFDIPSPVYVTAGLFVLMYVLLNWTRIGRYLYAVGGNLKASRLSGISTRFYLFMAYVLCGGLAAVAGALLTARLETGEANIGASMPLDSIAACVIGGVRSGAWWHGPTRQCRTRCRVYRPYSEWHGSGADTVIPAGGCDRRAAYSSGHR